MRKTKIFITFIIVLCLILAFGLVACVNDNDRPQNPEEPTNQECSHSFGEWQVTAKATCTTAGEKVRKCSKCNNEERLPISALGHNFGDWTIVTPATCIAEGLEERICANNSEHKETRPIAKLPHTYTQKHNETYHWQECVCGDIINKLSHNLGDLIVLEPANCTDNGTGKHICEDCDYEKQVTIPKLEHNFGDWTIVTPATCIAEGLEERICANNSEHKETRPIAKLPHTYTQKHNETYHWQECVCGDIINKLSHNLGDLIVLEPANCTDNGTGKHICEDCDYEKQVTIPKLEHNFGDWTIVTPATCIAEGLEERICANDSEHKETRPIPKINHILDEAGHCTTPNCDYFEPIEPQEGVLEFAINGDNASVVGIGTEKRTDIVIPDEYVENDISYPVTSIGDNAFKGCTNITSVVIPDSVQLVGASAFYGCSGLKSVVVGKSVVSMDTKAFYKCEGLEAVYISNLVGWCSIMFYGAVSNSYQANPLYYAGNLYLDGALFTSLEISEYITNVNGYIFAGCTSLTSVVIPDWVETIGHYAFYRCVNLTSMTMGTGIKTIHTYAFDGCGKMVGELTNQPYLQSVENYAFNNCSSLTGLVIPDTMYDILYKAFNNCSGITSLVIHKGLCKIGSWAFAGCTGLSGELVIPDSVDGIGDRVFENCAGLTSLIIGNGARNIGYYAFRNCSNLTRVEIGSSICNIGDEAFKGCEKLTEVYNYSTLLIEAGSISNGYVGYYATEIHTSKP